MRIVTISALLVGIAAISTPVAAGTSDAATLTALEAKWSAISMTKDVKALDRILAPTWHGQNKSGKRADKAMALKDLADPSSSVTKIVNHDVHVQVIGTVAIVQGADDETSTYKGKDSSGTYTWTDVFQKQGGRWVAIASQSTKVEPS